jgi:5-(aminomethyl)-3-furanmethanol phosphate kinase
MSEKVLGYVDYGIDAVVKFGGSLLIDEALTASAINALEGCLAVGKTVLVIPGGGPTDKTIEKIDRRAALAPATHHRACARAQDQTGLIICDPAFSRVLSACETLEEARSIAATGRIPVLLPSKLIFDIDPFEKTWDITSDGVALWFAWLLNAPLTAVLTNVDGIFEPGADFASTAPVSSISATRLRDWGDTAVDKCVPEFAAYRKLRTWVGHGGYSDRLPAALTGRKTIGTFIEP